MNRLSYITNIFLTIILIFYWSYSEYRYNKLLDKLNSKKVATLNINIKPVKDSGVVSQNDRIILYKDSILSLKIDKVTGKIKYRVKIKPVKVNIQLTPKGISLMPYDTARAKIDIINNTNIKQTDNRPKIALTTTMPNRLSISLLYRHLIIGVSSFWWNNSIKFSPLVGIYIPL